MRRVTVINHVSLDGVMQSPGAPDEDTRDGFDLGGWASRNDDTLGQAMGPVMGPDFSFLFGRRTYDQLLESWNRQGGPFKEALNATPKFVVSHNPQAAMPWDNSTLVTGEAVQTVAGLRDAAGGNLVVFGSGEMIGVLLPHGLVDDLLLMIHPVVLGRGHRLFPPIGRPMDLQLIEAVASPSGVLIARYSRN